MSKYLVGFVALVVIASMTACGGDLECSDTQVECDGKCIDAIEPTADALAAPVFQNSCAFSSCHKGYGAKESLDLSTADAVRAMVDTMSLQMDGVKLVDAGPPETSYVIHKLRNQNIADKDSRGDSATEMPPGAPLCEAKIAAVEAWIAAGAQ